MCRDSCAALNTHTQTQCLHVHVSMAMQPFTHTHSMHACVDDYPSHTLHACMHVQVSMAELAMQLARDSFETRLRTQSICAGGRGTCDDYGLQRTVDEIDGWSSDEEVGTGAVHGSTYAVVFQKYR